MDGQRNSNHDEGGDSSTPPPPLPTTSQHSTGVNVAHEAHYDGWGMAGHYAPQHQMAHM